MMYLNIIRNTFVNIRINSLTLHFHHSDRFQNVRIFLYRKQLEKYSAKWDWGLCVTSDVMHHGIPEAVYKVADITVTNTCCCHMTSFNNINLTDYYSYRAFGGQNKSQAIYSCIPLKAIQYYIII